jgi:hypothetical protein
MRRTLAQRIAERRADASRRGKLGAAARERNRLAEAARAVEVGLVRFSGLAFGGEHRIRVLHRDGETRVLPEIDGWPCAATTLRGLVRAVVMRLWAIRIKEIR